MRKLVLFLLLFVIQSPAIADRQDFDIVIRETDLDANSNVSYAVSVSYLQCGRKEWLDSVGMSSAAQAKMGITTIVVNINVDYMSEIHAGDKLKVKTCLTRVRAKSFTFRQIVVKSDGTVAISGSVTMVAKDLKTCLAIPVPRAIADCLVEEETRPGPNHPSNGPLTSTK